MRATEIIKDEHIGLFVVLSLLFIATLSITILSEELHKVSYQSVSVNAFERMTLNANDPYIAVTQVTALCSQKLSDVQLSVEKTTRVPSALQGVYQYIFIQASFKDQDIASAEIVFRVSKQWLAESGYDKRLVQMHRYAASTWSRVNTQLINEDDTHYYYKAYPAGFSYFAITAAKNPNVPPPAQPNATQPPVVEQPTNVTIITPPARPPWTLWLLSIIGFGVLIAVALIIVKHKGPMVAMSQMTSKSRGYLHLRSGLVVSNIKELRHALKSMNDLTFQHHLEAHDIPQWVEQQLSDPELAELLKGSKTREEMLHAIDNYQKISSILTERQ